MKTSDMGKKLRDARLRAGWTQEELSRLVKIQQRRLSKIECGHVSWIRSDTLKKLCEILHISPNELLDYQPVA